MSFLDPPHLIYPHEAPAECGVRAGTVRQWANRGKLHPRGLDEYGRKKYDVKDIQEMATSATRRHHGSSNVTGEQRCNVHAAPEVCPQ